MDINLFLGVVDLIKRFHQEQPGDPTRIGQSRAGYDARLLEINKVIYNKLWIAGQARVINSRCRELHGVDYPTFHKNEKERRTKC